jgi:hypothetical protein
VSLNTASAGGTRRESQTCGAGGGGQVRYEGREVTLQLPERADLEWAVHEAMTAFNLLKSRHKVRRLLAAHGRFIHPSPSIVAMRHLALRH